MAGNEVARQSVSPMLAEAFQYHQAGELAHAQRYYEQALEIDPNNSTAWHYLGMVGFQGGKMDHAATCLQHAIRLSAHPAMSYTLLGRVRKASGDFEGAIKCYQKAVEMSPESVETHISLGIVLRHQGRLEEAAQCYQRALDNNAHSFEARNNLANVLHDLGHIAAATDHYEQAILLDPAAAEPRSNLAVLLHNQGRVGEAIAQFELAIRIKPGLIDAHIGLGNALHGEGQLELAVRHYKNALNISERQLGTQDTGGAVERQRGAVLNNLGSALLKLGDFELGLAHFEQALSVQPDHDDAITNLLMSANYREENRLGILERCQRIAKTMSMHTKGLNGNEQAWVRRDRSPARPLRIGYVSPDFRRHSVAYFMEPVFAHHDRGNFSVYCYFNHTQSDVVTRRFKQYTDGWRDIAYSDDASVAALIVEDQIDILIDLAGRTNGHRLGVFKRKPAPIQMTYLGYPTLTAVPTMDYRITDKHVDPDTETGLDSEQPLRLPASYFCYRPDPAAPDLCAPPVLSRGYITFASFNNYVKVSPTVISAWVAILNTVPHSRMMLKAQAYGDESVRQRVLKEFERHGIARERIELLSTTSTVEEHLAHYQEVDISLDTYPYNGATTTCESLWMGVPVVTWRGETHASRMGASILTALDMAMFVAHSHEQYVAYAVRLAANPRELAPLRVALRGLIKRSPLRAEASHTGALEKLYRDSWRRYVSERVRFE